jgi:hypothetical protein
MTWRTQVTVTESDRSTTWDGAEPQATVLVASCDRAHWIPELVRSLERQGIPLELVLVDDSSREPVTLPPTDLPVLLLRTERRAGPSAARNAAAARGRAPVLLLTDDDCLPEAGWARSLLAALPGHGIVQGRTEPSPDPHGPWDRTITVSGLTGLWETCNLAVDAEAFAAAGGFADLGLLPGPTARGFGEDVELGATLAREHGGAFAGDALVRHRWIAGSYRDHLAARARLAGFPGLARHVPELPLVGGALLSRKTVVTDLGLLGLAATAATPWAAAAAAPWVLRSVRDARHLPGRGRWVRAAQLAVADVVGAASLVRGSVRARRVVL